MAANEVQRQTIGNVSEDRRMVHVHTYSTETDVADDHQHVITGISSPARDKGGSHVHRISSRSSFLVEGCSGHWHRFDVMSGPAVEMPDGNHTHYFSGDTSVDDRHCHSAQGVTGLGPSMPMAAASQECQEDEDMAEVEVCPHIPLHMKAKYREGLKAQEELEND